MNMQNIIIATAVVAAVGLVIAVLLSIAEKAFHVEVDERESQIRDCLGGNNCGACGYAGCDALAKAIVSGEAEVNACPPAGQSGADKIAEIMGVSAGEFVRKTAFVACSGTADKSISARKLVPRLRQVWVSAKCRAASAVSATAIVPRFATTEPSAL